ncbi:MAG: hypothetical protein A2X22_06100 [Bacteroidetes bacterium GWF2_49_14]|nr:MAG: hypothetical protein A2X22_06100 [Bacteroidetes bacterium GWF2_49_14]HBB91557.1 hypothetical protein [Bacteroidales bacterium]
MKTRGFKQFVFIAAALLGWINQPAIGQVSKVTARIDTTRMLIGDQVNLWLELDQASKQIIHFPSPGDSIAGKIEVLSASRPDTIAHTKQSWKLRQRIVLTAFDTGFYVIPPFVFRFADGSDSLKTAALGLEVLGIPVDTTKGITDIKAPYEIPVSFVEVVPYLVVGLLLVLIILLYIRYIRKKRKQLEDAPRPEIPPVPAHIWALGELDELVREKLWQQGKVKLYYSRLTDILRRYIELRFLFPAMEQTTDEIMSDFRKAGNLPENISLELFNLLQLADLVKFAKWNPVAEEHESSQKSSYDFVLRTKPVVNLRKPSDEAGTYAEKEALS